MFALISASILISVYQITVELIGQQVSSTCLTLKILELPLKDTIKDGSFKHTLPT